MGIVAVFIVFILGKAVLIVLACSAKPDLVCADYYEQEIRYQTQLDRLNRAGRVASEITMTYDAAARRIVLQLPPAHAALARGRIELYRPSEAALDQHRELQLDANGQQVLDATELQPGLWKLKLNWTVVAEEFAAEQALVVSGGKSP